MDIIQPQRIINRQQTYCQRRVSADALHVVRYRCFLLADEIRQQHDHEIANKAAAARSPVADQRHSDHLDHQGDHQTDEREISTPLGLVRQFVPEREVEIDALEDIRPKHYRHNLQSLPVIGSNNVPEYIQVEDNP